MRRGSLLVAEARARAASAAPPPTQPAPTPVAQTPAASTPAAPSAFVVPGYTLGALHQSFVDSGHPLDVPVPIAQGCYLVLGVADMPSFGLAVDGRLGPAAAPTPGSSPSAAYYYSAIGADGCVPVSAPAESPTPRIVLDPRGLPGKAIILVYMRA